MRSWPDFVVCGVGRLAVAVVVILLLAAGKNGVVVRFQLHPNVRRQECSILPSSDAVASEKDFRDLLSRGWVTLRSCAEFDALEKVRELVPDDGEGAQQVVVFGFACILETNSAGLSILFDRFDDDGLEKIRSSLEIIGATRTHDAFRGLQKAFAAAITGGKDRLSAADWLAAEPDSQRIDRDREAQVNEMEQKLLEFCRSHLGELAAG